MDPRQLVKSWLHGRASLDDAMTVRFAAAPARGLANRFRQAYHWIADNAVHVPFHDIDLGPPLVIGKGDARIEFPREAAYGSFILLPLLNLLTSRRLVFVGGPGRGKTTMATLMALLAGAPLDQVRQSIQHGHPQLTLADLLGSPLPGDLLKAEQPGDIKVRSDFLLESPGPEHRSEPNSESQKK